MRASAVPAVRWGSGVAEPQVGVLGATSLVGQCLLPLLTKARWRVIAFSRRAIEPDGSGVEWRKLEATPSHRRTDHCGALPLGQQQIPFWLCAAPLWVLPDYLDFITACDGRRVVALSSTSRFTKDRSSDAAEQAIARKLAAAEDHLQAWGERTGQEWVILRPTLIYGRGRDKNVCEIARFIRRFGFFPVFGPAQGLRQPLHADDLAAACVSALSTAAAANKAYNLSGGETLPYRDMVSRIFVAMNRPPRLLTVPLGVLRMGLAAIRLLPRYRHWSVAMAERMISDLVFDHAEAVHDLAFAPRPFRLTAADIDPGSTAADEGIYQQ